MALWRAVSTIGGFTLLSRIFGFVRDVLVARYLGAGLLADAFLVAFKLPNFLRRLFAEGAFNAAFVPIFSGTLEKQGEEAARRAAEEVLSVLLTTVLGVVILAEIAMPLVIMAFAPGFIDEGAKFDLTVTLARICFPYILMMALITLLSGVLNSFQRFAAVAATPILLNICLISALLWLTPYMQSPAHAVSVGVMAAGVVQFIWLVAACKRAGIELKIGIPTLTPTVKRLLKRAAPVALGAGVAQVNLLIDVILASLFSGAVSWLYYADRLNELPIGVIGVAIGTALLPMLSRQIQSSNPQAAITSLNTALIGAAALGLPAMAALLVLAEPFVRTLYQHGAFTAADTAAVVPAMMAYSLGLPAFILIKVFAPGFYAREDTTTPVKIAILCVGINISGNLILMQFIGHVGLALATSISSLVNAGLMGWVLYRRGHFQPDQMVISGILKIILASQIMAIILLFALPYAEFDTFRHRIISTILLICTGGVVYMLCLLALFWQSRYAIYHGLRPKRKAAP